MPTKRMAACACESGGRIYVIGGHALGEALTTVEMYNPVTDTWETGPSLPAPRVYHACPAIDGKIYVVGGLGAAWADAKLQ